MKTTIHILFTFFILLQFKPVFGIIHIDTAYIYTTYYSSDSSNVYLVTMTRFPNSPCALENVSISDSFDSTTINFCVSNGVISSTCARTDTTYLGYKKNEILNIKAIFSITNTHCATFFDTKTIDVTFYIGYNDASPIPFLQENITLSPNPTTSKLSLQLNNNQTTKLTYQILSIDGRILMQNAITTQPNLEIDVSTLPAGLYFLQLQACLPDRQDERQRWVKKFVKE